MSYINKYLKYGGDKVASPGANIYQNKYIELKKKLNGGAIVTRGMNIGEPDKFENFYHGLMYHGDVLPKNVMTVPNNIYLIIADCCGVSNISNSNTFFTGIKSNDTNIITKDELYTQIKSGNIINED